MTVTPDMGTYTVTLSLPVPGSNEKLTFSLAAPTEDDAIDRAFNKAFAYYPEYGAFQIDSVERRS